jgi:hypothetical protein
MENNEILVCKTKLGTFECFYTQKAVREAYCYAVHDGKRYLSIRQVPSVVKMLLKGANIKLALHSAKELNKMGV